MKPTALSGFLIFCVLLIVGCSSQVAPDVPRPEMAQKYLENFIRERSVGKIRLAHFKKTDGVASEMFGVKNYTLEYEVKVEILEDGYWDYNVKIFTFIPAGEAKKENIYPAWKYSPAKKGEQVFLTGWTSFTKKESGWVYNEGKIEAHLEGKDKNK